MEDAVKSNRDGTLINLVVSPNAKKTEVVGYNEWRRAIEVRVKSPPKGGKANAELVKFFKEIFGCEVKIIRGRTSAQKTILIEGVSKEVVLKILRRNISKQS